MGRAATGGRCVSMSGAASSTISSRREVGTTSAPAWASARAMHASDARGSANDHGRAAGQIERRVGIRRDQRTGDARGQEEPRCAPDAASRPNPPPPASPAARSGDRDRRPRAPAPAGRGRDARSSRHARAWRHARGSRGRCCGAPAPIPSGRARGWWSSSAARRTAPTPFRPATPGSGLPDAAATARWNRMS